MTKVRFAPSPTGDLHIGNVRIALMNHLFAQKEGGRFILRIEDTDLDRSDRSFEASILSDLRWLAINWDEGPFRQSDRWPVYRSFADGLMARNCAYKCFCSREDLEEMRKNDLSRGRAPRYSGAYAALSPDDIRRNEAMGKSHVVRIRSLKEEISFTDGVFGPISFPPDHIDDFIIMRQDGRPSYNFAAAVDDMEMAITHVIRGSDHLSNTPKQIMLFRLFGLTPPAYSHLSMLTGDDGKPLSKRHGVTSIAGLREEGFLSGAIVNYLAVAGRKVADELMSPEEMVSTFALSTFSSSDTLFDLKKLLWFNKEYLRRLSEKDLLSELGLSGEWAGRVAVLRENGATLKELRDLLDIFTGEETKADALEFLGRETHLTSHIPIVAAMAADGAGSSFDNLIGCSMEKTGLKKREVMMLTRIVLTGRLKGPPLSTLYEFISRDSIMKRLAWLKQNCPGF